VIVFPVAICVPFLLGWQLHWSTLVDALWFGGGAGVAGLMMTALLPFFERWFDIQTDISLLELSDPNHPLLKQLIQRAPGTYNHSINVASIAETAAEAIGANGLLCRVGAYFHDIGKMRKPEYFVENQASGANKHDELVPTMSTIVIISHVKDGIEMARQHRLPRRIVDMIEQHHGTTVIEYFYHRATQQSTEENRLEESDFRYPGPRPQSIETAILMLSDAIEGASRTLREPTPARIESIVNEIAKKRMDDGQFDDCPITLQQIYTIQESLTKSLNAMFHARVKYPEQQTA
jgi:putative nucleotidyltransferase with HDIG domain